MEILSILSFEAYLFLFTIIGEIMRSIINNFFDAYGLRKYAVSAGGTHDLRFISPKPPTPHAVTEIAKSI